MADGDGGATYLVRHPEATMESYRRGAAAGRVFTARGMREARRFVEHLLGLGPGARFRLYHSRRHRTEAFARGRRVSAPRRLGALFAETAADLRRRHPGRFAGRLTRASLGWIRRGFARWARESAAARAAARAVTREARVMRGEVRVLFTHDDVIALYLLGRGARPAFVGTGEWVRMDGAGLRRGGRSPIVRAGKRRRRHAPR